jgi:hypothetical protein
MQMNVILQEADGGIGGQMVSPRKISFFLVAPSILLLPAPV